MSASLPPPSLLESLATLKSLIRAIPSSCPPAPKDGPIHRNFSTYDVPEGETLYFAIDLAWNRTFQGSRNEPIGGRYGVGTVYKFFSHFSKQPLGGDFALLELRVSQFIRLVENVLESMALAAGGVHAATEPSKQQSAVISRVSESGQPAKEPPSYAPLTSDDEAGNQSDGSDSTQDNLPDSKHDGVSTAEDEELGSVFSDNDERMSDYQDETDAEEEIVEVKEKEFKKSVGNRGTTSKTSAPTPSHVKVPSKRTQKKPSMPHQTKPKPKNLISKPTPSRGHRSAAKVKSPKRARFSRTTAKSKKVSVTTKELSRKPTDGAKENASKEPLSGSSGSEAEDGGDVGDVPANGRKPAKATWAFEQFEPTPGTSKAGEPVWVWRCRWCTVIRTSPRTSKVREYNKEPLPHPKSSNFISHLKQPTCPIPEEFSFENRGKEQPETSGLAGPVTGYAAQRKMILDFTAQGKIAPARKFTKEGFRTAFVKGVVEDGLPFTFGEGRGMKKLFEYSLPEVSLPKRMSVRRDLDVLYTALQSELWARLKSLKSRPSIAFDIWSSRNSAFAFIGIKAFWISPDWVLESHVLDLVHLDGDHGGATSGKLIFNSLKEAGIAEKMTHDNAKSNGVTNRAIAKRRAKAFRVPADPKRMGLGCAGHVIHLSAQDLLAAFDIVEPTSEVDHYHDTNRQYGLHYSAETDPDILAQEAELESAQENARRSKRKAAEAKAKERRTEKPSRKNARGNITLVSDSSESEEADNRSAEENGFEDEETDGTDSDFEEEPQSEAATRSARPRPGILNPLEKIHTFVVHVNCSVIRRGTFRKLVEKHCPSDCHRLTLVKGMPVRWNSSHAEYKRAYRLRLAIDAYIVQMTQGKTGKKLSEARKRQAEWYMSFHEWESVSQLCEVLEVYQIATSDLSRSDLPTLSMVLPLYKEIEVKLEQGINAAKQSALHSVTGSITETAYQAALNKLTKYIADVCDSPLHLIATALHPAMRLSWFEDRTYWPSGTMATRVRVLLTTMYAEYEEKLEKDSSASSDSRQLEPPTSARPSKASSLLANAVSTRKTRHGHEAELNSYLQGALVCEHWDEVLQWWKINEIAFPVLARMARDVLAAPGVSISVKRLFSVCRHVMTETRTSMSASTATKTVCAKEWLHEGVGDAILSFSGLPSQHD